MTTRELNASKIAWLSMVAEALICDYKFTSKRGNDRLSLALGTPFVGMAATSRLSR